MAMDRSAFLLGTSELLFVIEESEELLVPVGDYSAPGDELHRLTQIPISMVRTARTLEKKLYLPR